MSFPAVELKVHETTTKDGLAPVFLRFEDGVLAITSDDGAFPLPEGALAAVMERYGAPLETTEKLVHVGALDLGGGRTLRQVRHLARYDVIARDFLVYEASGHDPICALATTVAGVLGHLGRAARAALDVAASDG